jgi:hypothetical protein
MKIERMEAEREERRKAMQEVRDDTLIEITLTCWDKLAHLC